MKKETLDFVKEKTAALIAAHSCSAEAKAAAEKWLAAVGTAEEAEATKAYIAELEADIMPIDGLIAFAGSEAGVVVFGAFFILRRSGGIVRCVRCRFSATSCKR